ncbi:MAG: bifunctional non-ous end joining protein LigD [Thermoleophilaceae bacterium]|jgi:bifunctional non-homologous end joining protein LigD|nr:bifunctional non-ous end joining protein LigD [Thermoleophilaceae bacterium]
MPEHIVPMLARLSTLPPGDERWGYEIKWDGVRAVAYVSPGKPTRIESRNLNDVTRQYPEAAAVGAALEKRSAVLDGEVVAFDEHGRPSFERLQGRMHLTGEAAIGVRTQSTPIAYVVFDLLYLDGESLMRLPYSERRARLEGLDLNGPSWRTPAYHQGEGAALLEASAKQGLEGVVAKRLDSPYEPGKRNGAWLKIKNTRRQELVIGGWLPGEGRRQGRIGALLMGYYDHEPATPELRFAGKVGTGFDAKELDKLGALLAGRRRPTSPFSGPRQPGKGAIYVDPDLVAEVEFNEWTRQNMLRHPSYKGLREDKRALDVVLERPEPPG